MIVTSKILQSLNMLAAIFPAFIFVFTFKGFFQALAAKIMGDDTPQREGFLSLNPLAHIEVFGLTLVLVVYFFIGGLLGETIPRALLFILLITLGARWIHPVIIDESNFKNYRLGGILTAISGSIGNFILAFLALIAFRITALFSIPPYAQVTILEIIKAITDLSIFFGILDLIPIPPFDGGRILRYLLPYSQQHIVAWLEQYSLFILLILFFAPGISNIFLGSIALGGASIKMLLVKIAFLF